MNKNYIFKILLVASGLAVTLLWFISMFDTGSRFNIYWGITILGGLSGTLFILRGLLTDKLVTLKRVDIALGTALIISGILALIGNYTGFNRYALPLIAVAVMAAILIGIIATGKHKWDKGDNQDPGYKDYYQRKAEKEREEKQKNEGDDSRDN